MVDYTAPLYQHAQEVWDEAKCTKVARSIAKDGMGTPYHYRGHIHGTGAGSIGGYGTTRYNGGCVHDGKWWQGENRPLPAVHKDFEFVCVLSWGTRLKRKDSE